MIMVSKRPDVNIWTDGSTYPGNPGTGGWSAILLCNKRIRALAGWVDRATNNNMETMGVLRGLAILTQPSVVTIYTDSQYVILGMSAALNGRILKTNTELWEQIHRILHHSGHVVRMRKIKGHSGEELNEWADGLAAESAVHKIQQDYYAKAIPEAYKRKAERVRRSAKNRAARVPGY